MGVKTSLSALVAIALGATISFSPLSAEPLENRLENAVKVEDCIVKRVIDGDTFLTYDGEYVRLAGIDTPEIKGRRHRVDQPYAVEAKQRLTYLIQQAEGKVKLVLYEKERDRDAYRRLLREVFVGDTCLNLQMIEEGYAMDKNYGDRRHYTSQLAEAEERAKAEKKNLWSE